MATNEINLPEQTSVARGENKLINSPTPDNLRDPTTPINIHTVLANMYKCHRSLLTKIRLVIASLVGNCNEVFLPLAVVNRL